MTNKPAAPSGCVARNRMLVPAARAKKPVRRGGGDEAAVLTEAMR
jgi:hypothetical protein